MLELPTIWSCSSQVLFSSCFRWYACYVLFKS
jgi:hypothetical protein